MRDLYKILDANINRAAEGLRVIEDISRFMLLKKSLTQSIRQIRHTIRKIFCDVDSLLVSSRNSHEDIGKDISQNTSIDNKTNIKNLVYANIKRVTEALRVIEETSKLTKYKKEYKKIELIRYEIYTIETTLNEIFKKKIPLGIYAITADEFCIGISNIECVKAMVDSGIRIIQYRDKHKTIKEKLREAKEISKICKDNEVLFIVNDHIDIAYIVNADGVHVGQEDIDIQSIRGLLGQDKIVGLSTSSVLEARGAIRDGVDYVGVGPIFKTSTKPKPPVGLEYLEYATKNIDIPFVAIGGIKENNIEEVLKIGAKRVALVSDIVGAKDIKSKIKRINKLFKNYI